MKSNFLVRVLSFSLVCLALPLGAQDVPTWHKGDTWPLKRSMDITYKTDLYRADLQVTADYEMTADGVEDRSKEHPFAGDVYVCTYRNAIPALSGNLEILPLFMKIRDLHIKEGTGVFEGEVWYRRSDLAIVRMDMDIAGAIRGTVGSGILERTGDLMRFDIKTSTTFTPPLEHVDFPLWYGEADWFTNVVLQSTVSYDLNSRDLPDPLPLITDDTIDEQGVEESISGLPAQVSYVEKTDVGGFGNCRHIAVWDEASSSSFARFYYHPPVEYFARTVIPDFSTGELEVKNLIEEMTGSAFLAPEPFFLFGEPRIILSLGFGTVYGWDGLGKIMFPTALLPDKTTMSPYHFLALLGPDATLVEKEVGSHGVVVEEADGDYNVTTITEVREVRDIPELILPSLAVREGEDIILPVTVRDASRFCSFECDFHFDPGVISFVEARKGDDITSWPLFDASLSGDVIHVSGFTDREKALDGDLEICRLSFGTIPDVVGTSIIKVLNMTDGLWNAYAGNGEVIVKYFIFKDELVGHLLSRKSIPDYKLPDADQNGDGLLDIADVVWMSILGE